MPRIHAGVSPAIDVRGNWGDSSEMRVVIALVAVGLALLLISVFLVGRDLSFARDEAEREVLAFAEASALAIQFAPANAIEPYLSGLLKHPAIEMATVYSSNGTRTTRRRPPGEEPPFIRRMVPSLGEPVVGCRAVGSSSVCLQGDMTYFHRRLAALFIPHAILLVASALLLMVAIALGRGSNRGQIAEVVRVLRGASEENDYSLRASEVKGNLGELARASNKLLEQMHQRDIILRRRTTEMESANRELEAFSYSVSHDLRTPLAGVDGFSQALNEEYAERLDERGTEYLRWIRDGVEQMKNLVAGLLEMSRLARAEINHTRVDLSEMANSIAESLRQRDPSRSVDFRIQPALVADGDERLLHAVLQNLMSNAFKFTGKKEKAVIAVGSNIDRGRPCYFVKDNGAGFDSTQASRMFTPFQRLHSNQEFEGTGIGLSTVKRIIERHGGAIWADGEVGQGATFSFTLGESAVAGSRAEVSELTPA
jgi:signal transduction histidine kinase